MHLSDRNHPPAHQLLRTVAQGGIPFAWSIADGIAFGFISYPLLKLLGGRPREASPLVYALGIIFVLRRTTHPTRNALLGP